MRVSKDMLARWTKYCRLYLQERNHSLEDITSPYDVWGIAGTLDITREAYHVGLNDNHIETALRRIFPNWKQVS